MSKSFESSRAPEPVGAFPHAKRVGNLLFLSGIGPRVRGSKEIPGVSLDSVGNILNYDIEAQCRAVFENVRLVLEDADASWNDIVDVTVFLTHMKKDFPIYNRLYAEHFAGPGKPNPICDLRSRMCFLLTLLVTRSSSSMSSANRWRN